MSYALKSINTIIYADNVLTITVVKHKKYHKISPLTKCWPRPQEAYLSLLQSGMA